MAHLGPLFLIWRNKRDLLLSYSPGVSENGARCSKWVHVTLSSSSYGSTEIHKDMELINSFTHQFLCFQDFIEHIQYLKV